MLLLDLLRLDADNFVGLRWADGAGVVKVPFAADMIVVDCRS